MGILAWVVLGLFAGFVASKLVNKTGEGFLGDVILGIIGAVVGGFVANALGIQGISGLNIWSLLIATLGAVIALVVYHAITGSRRVV
jgi:uncharacterized membrane protein YeaQ/YmgE (transglycosylase-associated protein family)